MLLFGVPLRDRIIGPLQALMLIACHLAYEWRLSESIRALHHDERLALRARDRVV